MTVIAWDGKSLAADRRSCRQGSMYASTKLYRVGDRIVGFFGQADRTGEFCAWLENGADAGKYPNNKGDGTCFFIAIRPDGVIERYETTGYPIIVEEKQFACGSGGDYAMAAMHLGCDARQAVEVACLFDEGCGNGVDTLELERKKTLELK